LKKITLDHNKIHTIQPFAFKVKISSPFSSQTQMQGVSNVEEISLRWNPIETISGFAFAGMRNVSQIYLGYNKWDTPILLLTQYTNICRILFADKK
jgi:hypothetical protein